MIYDEHSLKSWLESQALEAHHVAAKIAESRIKFPKGEYGNILACSERCFKREEEIYNKVLTHLRNGHTTELHRKLMEK